MNPFNHDLFEPAASGPEKSFRGDQQAKMIKLSPSSLNLFLGCPRCFWLYLNKGLKRPSIPVATITTGLDKVIKEYCNIYREKNILPPFLEGKVPGKLMRNLPRRGWLDFNDDKMDARLGGYLDECLELGDNLYAALDHKTRGSIPEGTHKAYQFQMDAYTFLLEQNGLPTCKVAYLVYYIPKGVATSKAIEFEVFPSQVKTDPEYAKQVFYDAVSMLTKPIPAAHKDCEFCKWTTTINIK